MIRSVVRAIGRASLGRVARVLARVAQGKPARSALGALDRRLDLGYLAERLIHEDAAIERLLDEYPPGDRIRISVIVPVYGVSLRDIDDLVQSLCEQTHDAWELCLCDDGDPTPAVRDRLTRLAADDPTRVKLVRHAQNRGIPAATRSALALATGDVIAFADADDRLHSRALEAIARRFVSSDAIDVVYTDHDLLTEWGHRIRPVRKPAISPELLLLVNYVNHLVAARRDCVNRCTDLFPDDLAGAQDWDFVWKAVHAATRVSHVPLVLYHWRARPESVAGSRAREAKPWVFSAADELRRRLAVAMDPRLRYEAGALRLAEKNVAPDLEVLSIDSIGATLAPQSIDYQGHVRVRDIANDTTDLARRLDQAIEGLSDDHVVLILEAGAAPLVGDIGLMMAFALLPSVACVWPFRTTELRNAYTVDVRRAGVTAIATRRSSFSSETGNVLTGPLHGLMIRVGVLRAIGGFVAASARVIDWEPLARLGAALGLAALRAGRRNVAVRGVVSAELPPFISIEGVPALDPYC